jgi:hypothetical protein
LRDLLYVGRPSAKNLVFERPVPVLENHLHVWHNLQQWFWFDWREGRVFIAAGVSSVVAWWFWQLRRRELRRAAIWSLAVFASIIAFGYVNETRHYLLLAAFWFGYRCPRVQFDVQGSKPESPMPSGK